MSNASGICNKSDYCIEPVGEKLAIYLHNTNNDINKIKNAYDILCAINNANIDCIINNSLEVLICIKFKY